jgi:anti-sigma factor RsiW
MKHLSDETINECLDQTLAPDQRELVEAHLAACPFCAGRIAELRALFANLDALPDLALELDFAPAVIRQIAEQQPISIPWPVRWLAGLQVVVILLAGVLAWPLAAASLPAGLSIPALPSGLELFGLVNIIFAARLNLAGNLRLPALTIPVIDLPSATLLYSALGLSLLWLLGNGLFFFSGSRRKL